MKSALNGITPFILMVITPEGSYSFTNPKMLIDPTSEALYGMVLVKDALYYPYGKK